LSLVTCHSSRDYHSLVKVLALWCLMAAGSGPVVVDRIAATVDGVAITESAVRRAVVTSGLQAEAGESAQAVRERLLDALIDQHLQYDDAVRFGPAPPEPSDVTAAVEKLKERLRSEGKDPDKEIAGAGLSQEELRAMVERQLVVQRHLRERFRPVAIADEDRAREEYQRSYVPERKAAGLPVAPFETVSDEMRARSQKRIFDEEVDKWMKDLRLRARIEILRLPPPDAPQTKPL